MSIKPDAWIKRMAESEGMIEPFSENQVRVDEKGEKLISYGVSSFGYDVRCANEFKVFTNVNNTIVDPFNINQQQISITINLDLHGYISDKDQTTNSIKTLIESNNLKLENDNMKTLCDIIYYKIFCCLNTKKTYKKSHTWSIFITKYNLVN